MRWLALCAFLLLGAAHLFLETRADVDAGLPAINKEVFVESNDVEPSSKSEAASKTVGLSSKARKVLPVLVKLQNKYNSLKEPGRKKLLEKADTYREKFSSVLSEIDTDSASEYGLDLEFISKIRGEEVTYSQQPQPQQPVVEEEKYPSPPVPVEKYTAPTSPPPPKSDLPEVEVEEVPYDQSVIEETPRYPEGRVAAPLPTSEYSKAKKAESAGPYQAHLPDIPFPDHGVPRPKKPYVNKPYDAEFFHDPYDAYVGKLQINPLTYAGIGPDNAKPENAIPNPYRKQAEAAGLDYIPIEAMPTYNAKPIQPSSGSYPYMAAGLEKIRKLMESEDRYANLLNQLKAEYQPKELEQEDEEEDIYEPTQEEEDDNDDDEEVYEEEEEDDEDYMSSSPQGPSSPSYISPPIYPPLTFPSILPPSYQPYRPLTPPIYQTFQPSIPTVANTISNLGLNTLPFAGLNAIPQLTVDSYPNILHASPISMPLEPSLISPFLQHDLLERFGYAAAAVANDYGTTSGTGSSHVPDVVHVVNEYPENSYYQPMTASHRPDSQPLPTQTADQAAFYPEVSAYNYPFQLSPVPEPELPSAYAYNIPNYPIPEPEAPLTYPYIQYATHVPEPEVPEPYPAPVPYPNKVSGRSASPQHVTESHLYPAPAYPLEQPPVAYPNLPLAYPHQQTAYQVSAEAPELPLTYSQLPVTYPHEPQDPEPIVAYPQAHPAAYPNLAAAYPQVQAAAYPDLAAAYPETQGATYPQVQASAYSDVLAQAAYIQQLLSAYSQPQTAYPDLLSAYPTFPFLSGFPLTTTASHDDEYEEKEDTYTRMMDSDEDEEDDQD
eukprot:TRINITY_DN8916_c0_g1_i1.p1 TRINITY_DN8916_c0_g1~~TRINITY_DN8916_c0_g1_i1.p1  ORF type:complete len:830 (+),score=135.04 TRINITY_DN8916_c0_g1_i1:65-2554(+)